MFEIASPRSEMTLPPPPPPPNCAIIADPATFTASDFRVFGRDREPFVGGEPGASLASGGDAGGVGAAAGPATFGKAASVFKDSI